MNTLKEQCIRPFSPFPGMVQTKVSYEYLIRSIVEKQSVVQEERIASRIEACKEKIGQYIKAHSEMYQQTSQSYALLLLTGQCDCQSVIRLMIADMKVDNLSKSVSALVSADMQDYFGFSVSGLEAEFSIAVRGLFPAAYISSVLQEYINTLRLTKAMGKAVKQVCHKSLSRVELPWLLRQLSNRMDFGELLLNAYDCSPETQRHRLQRQVNACIQGMMTQLCTQIKNRYNESVIRTFYQAYDERGKQDFKLASIRKYKYPGTNWKRRKAQRYLYEIQCAV